MTIPKELVDAILRTHTDSKAFFAELCRVTAILRAGEERDAALRVAVDQHHARVAIIKKDYEAVVQSCGHEYQQHNPDPSGNNCLICGKESP